VIVSLIGDCIAAVRVHFHGAIFDQAGQRQGVVAEPPYRKLTPFESTAAAPSVIATMCWIGTPLEEDAEMPSGIIECQYQIIACQKEAAGAP
jgi:hypothetical protein